MKVGLQMMFQNLARGRSADHAVVAEDLALADLAVRSGFESLWCTEHHFAGYSMIPNQLIALAHLAGRHPHIEVGTAVVVIPWHNPLRAAGEVALLDSLVGGRLLLGIGRGLGRTEFEAFGIPMEESRDRFVEGARLLLDALDSGTAEFDGVHYRAPRRELRPTPTRPFRDRSYAAAVSPESSEIMAKLGVGLMVSPQKPWPKAIADIEVYREQFVALHRTTPPAPVYSPKVFCDRDPGRARELSQLYMRRYFQAVLEHYEMGGAHFAKTKGYEFYASTARDVSADGGRDPIDGYIDVQVVGTPGECIEQIREVHRMIGPGAFVGLFGYGDMPYEDAARNLRTFAEHALPTIQRFEQPVGAVSG